MFVFPAVVAHAAAPDPLGWACPTTGVGPLSPTVAPGRYETEVLFSQSELHTLEHIEDRAVHGRLILDLRPEGTFDACLAWTVSGSTSVSRFGAPDGQPLYTVVDQRELQAWRGRWESIPAGGLRLIADQRAHGSCTPVAWAPTAALQLSCGTLPAGPRLPVAALACRWPENGPSNALGLDLGPPGSAWNRAEPDLPQTGRCGPWLVAGAAPGLTVRWDKEARADGTFTFTAGTSPFVP